jgi:hypothetical protein
MTKAQEKPRKPWQQRFIEDVKEFQAATGKEFTAIFRAAIANPRAWDRIEGGGSITLVKADEVYAYMASEGYHFNS